MANYHRNDTAGPQTTSMKTPLGAPVTMTFRSLKDDLETLRANAPAGIVDSAITKVGESEQGEDIHAIRIGKDGRPSVLIAGCHHAREWISVEVPFLIAEFLVNNYAADTKIKRIVDSLDIWIVPMVNPDGHEHSVLVNRMWRKNFPTDPARKKVDLNRNYDTAFWSTPIGQFSDTPSNDTYRGPSAGYAKEVIAMQDLIKDKKFKGTLDYHSFGRMVLFPWAGRADQHPDPHQQEMAGHVERIIDSKGTEYITLQTSEIYPFLSGGAITQARGIIPGDFMDYEVEQVPDSIAVGVELEPHTGDPRGFILPESEIEPTFKMHKASILTFLNCLTTIKKPTEIKPLLLREGNNDLVVFQPECWRAFAGY